MKKFIAIAAALVFTAATTFAQRKVASYAYTDPDTKIMETISFWTENGKRSDVTYYTTVVGLNENSTPTKVQYLGSELAGINGAFKLQMPNSSTMLVYPDKEEITVSDPSGRYAKVYKWKYESAVDGEGPFCTACMTTSTEAYNLIQSKYAH